jgi:hypothetical protein
VIGTLIPIRGELLKMVEKFLAGRCEELFGSSSGWIANRMGLLFYFYAEEIFEDNPAMFGTYLEYVMRVACTQNIPAAASIQAAKSITFLIREEPLLVKIENYTPNILAHMLAGTSWQKEPDFFEAL